MIRQSENETSTLECAILSDRGKVRTPAIMPNVPNAAPFSPPLGVKLLRCHASLFWPRALMNVCDILKYLTSAQLDWRRRVQLFQICPYARLIEFDIHHGR